MFLIKKIILFVCLFSLIWTSAYAWSQKNITINANSTVFEWIYKITNLTNKKIFAPFTDKSGNILKNSKSLNHISIWKSFWNWLSNKLNNTYQVGWFQIEDAKFYWKTWTYGSCNRSCWWWTKIRSVSCKREDNNISTNTGNAVVIYNKMLWLWTWSFYIKSIVPWVVKSEYIFKIKKFDKTYNSSSDYWNFKKDFLISTKFSQPIKLGSPEFYDMSWNLIAKNKWDKLSKEEQYELKKQGKFPRGILHHVEEPEYCEEYYKLIDRVRG